jgi:hypothetical protein
MLDLISISVVAATVVLEFERNNTQIFSGVLVSDISVLEDLHHCVPYSILPFICFLGALLTKPSFLFSSHILNQLVVDISDTFIFTEQL